MPLAATKLCLKHRPQSLQEAITNYAYSSIVPISVFVAAYVQQQCSTPRLIIRNTNRKAGPAWISYLREGAFAFYNVYTNFSTTTLPNVILSVSLSLLVFL